MDSQTKLVSKVKTEIDEVLSIFEKARGRSLEARINIGELSEGLLRDDPIAEELKTLKSSLVAAEGKISDSESKIKAGFKGLKGLVSDLAKARKTVEEDGKDSAN